jgi:hypothetical protein
MQFVHTIIFLTLPLYNAFTLWIFGLKRRFVKL